VTLTDQIKSNGAAGCHIISDDYSRVYVSHYLDGNLTEIPYKPDSGEFVKNQVKVHGHTYHGKHERQESPHAHQVQIDNKNNNLFLVDLGGDRIYQYKIDSHGIIENPDGPFVQLAEGSGPRHIVIHPILDYVYLINELDSTITIFNYDRKQGTLHSIQTVPSTPLNFSGKCFPAAIKLHPSGRTLYISNRFHDSIGVFAIDQTNGHLSWVQDQETYGRIPRDFTIDESGALMLVANQETDTVIPFKIDPEHHTLTRINHLSFDVKTPVCLVFYPL